MPSRQRLTTGRTPCSARSALRTSPLPAIGVLAQETAALPHLQTSLGLMRHHGQPARSHLRQPTQAAKFLSTQEAMPRQLPTPETTLMVLVDPEITLGRRLASCSVCSTRLEHDHRGDPHMTRFKKYLVARKSNTHRFETLWVCAYRNSRITSQRGTHAVHV